MEELIERARGNTSDKLVEIIFTHYSLPIENKDLFLACKDTARFISDHQKKVLAVLDCIIRNQNGRLMRSLV